MSETLYYPLGDDKSMVSFSAFSFKTKSCSSLSFTEFEPTKQKHAHKEMEMNNHELITAVADSRTPIDQTAVTRYQHDLKPPTCNGAECQVIAYILFCIFFSYNGDEIGQK